jgi:hypothetical protein
MQVQVQEQCPQRFADRGRVSHQVSDITEVLKTKTLADEQAEVPASGHVRADGQQVGEGAEWDAAFRIPEQARSYCRTRERTAGSDPKLCQHFGECHEGPDPDIAGHAWDQ